MWTHLVRAYPPEIIEDNPVSVVSPGRQDNRGGGIRLTGNPGTVEHKRRQEYGYHGYNDRCYLGKTCGYHGYNDGYYLGKTGVGTFP